MRVRLCPECGSDDLRPSSFRFWPDLLWLLLRRYAMRCRDCSARSYHHRRRHGSHAHVDSLVIRIVVPHPPRLLRALFHRQKVAAAAHDEALFEPMHQADPAELVSAGN